MLGIVNSKKELVKTFEGHIDAKAEEWITQGCSKCCEVTFTVMPWVH